MTKRDDKTGKLWASTRSPRLGQTKGAMEMSFGMIFSIILIIFFLSFAFFGIRTFLGVQDTAKTSKFLNDLQSDVEQVWKSSQTSQEKEYFLPGKKVQVCFADFSVDKRGGKAQIYDELKRAYYGDENLVFYPVVFGESESSEIIYLNLTRITENENPFCIENVDGKVRLRLTKDFTDSLVTITRVGS